MPKFSPFPKVKARTFTTMEEHNYQAVCDSIRQLEARISALQSENNALKLQSQSQSASSLFRIPDPIRIIPSFDGNKKQLTAWLTTVRRTLSLFTNNTTPPELLAIYEQTIINKIEGRARDTICVNGNPSTFEEAAEILQSVYGDRNTIATYQTQLWSMKMNESLNIHYKKVKEIMISMKSVARENDLYAKHWQAINHFLEQECLAAFINGLSKPYFGYAQTAQPNDLESAYAFLCRFQNAEKTKTQTQAVFEQNQSGKAFNNKKDKTSEKKFNSYSPKPQSDRQKPTPMDIDPTLRVSNRNKIFAHTTNNDEDSDSAEEVEQETPEQEEVNFQILSHENFPI